MLVSDKIYISAQELLEDSFRLGAKILKSGFRPTFIMAIWRGGAPIGIAVQEMLSFFGVVTDHIAIRTSSYTGINERSDDVRVHGLNYIVKNISHDDTLLIVDDVFDRGLTIQAVLAQLSARTRRNTPADIRVAVPWFKPTHNRTDLEPDYYINTTDKWLVFPHGLEGLTWEEIAAKPTPVADLLAGVKT